MITSSLLSCPNGLQIPVGDGGAWPPVPSEAASQGFHLMVDYWDSCTYLSDWSSIFCVDVDNVSVGLIVSASGLSPWDDPSAMADSSSLLGFLNCRDIFFFCTYFWSENDDRACNSLMKWVWLDGCWWCAWVPFFANLIRKYGENCDFEWESSFILFNKHENKCFWSENDDRTCNSLMKWVWFDGCWWCSLVLFFANLIIKLRGKMWSWAGKLLILFNQTRKWVFGLEIPGMV